MQQPTVIEAEPEKNTKERRLRNLLGCLLNVIPIVTIGMAVLIVAVCTYLYFSSDETNEELAEESQAETALAATTEGESLEAALEENAAMEEAMGAKTPDERARMLEEEYGHLDDNIDPAGGEDVSVAEGIEAMEGVVAERATDSANGANMLDGAAGGAGKGGASPMLEDFASGAAPGGAQGSQDAMAEFDQVRNYLISKGGVGLTDGNLKYEVIYQEWQGELRYRFFLFPYDSGLDGLMYTEDSEFALKFLGEEQGASLPLRGAVPVPLNQFEVFKAGGQNGGWVAEGSVPLESVTVDQLSSVRLSWSLEKHINDYLVADGSVNRSGEEITLD